MALSRMSKLSESSLLDAISWVEKSKNLTLKEFQRTSIVQICSGKDLFICAPTGSGKSLCYGLLTEVLNFAMRLNGPPTVLRPIVIVISPLVALISDQVDKLQTLGISACGITEDTEISIVKNARNGLYSTLLISPEGILGSYSSMLESTIFQEDTVAVIIDEAHCITEWGEGFRPMYQMLGKVRSILPSRVPLMALTATATMAMKDKIARSLCMRPDTEVLCVPTDRKNITYSVLHVKSGTFEPLRWLVELLMTTGEDCPKTVIFFRNVRSLALAFSFFCKELGSRLFLGDHIPQNRSVAMFHRATHESNKEFVLAEFPKPMSRVRILLATIAFGMGIDIRDIRYVLHFGCARSLEAFSQETGRAGRDGHRSSALTYYHSQNMSQGQCTESAKLLIKASECRRRILVDHFNLRGTLVTSDSQGGALSKCQCCDICAKTCVCGLCVAPLWGQTVSNQDLADTAEENDNQTSSQEHLRDNLMDYLTYMDEDSPPSMIKRSLLCGLNTDVIDIMTSLYASIEDEDGLSGLTGITDQETLRTLMEVIKESIEF